MKIEKLTILKYAFFLLSIFCTYQAVSAQSQDFQVEKVLFTEKREVTGDKKEDTLTIKGVRYQQQAGYFKKMSLLIETDGKTINIPLDSGGIPKLQFADLNKDGVKDVLVTSSTGESDGILTAYAYSFKDQKALNLSVPDTVPVTTEFLEEYQAKISIKGKKPVIIDLSDRKKRYDRLGIYQDGKLNEASELMVDGFSSLKFVYLLGKGKGLEGVQLVSGDKPTDKVAEIISKWSYEKGAWTLNKATVKPFQKSRKKS